MPVGRFTTCPAMMNVRTFPTYFSNSDILKAIVRSIYTVCPVLPRSSAHLVSGPQWAPPQNALICVALVSDWLFGHGEHIRSRHQSVSALDNMLIELIIPLGCTAISC